jgi:hypothetical protein
MGMFLNDGKDWTAGTLFGASVQVPTSAAGVSHSIAAMGPDSDKRGWRAMLDPDNPLFWAGLVILVTFGAAGGAGSVRLGGAKASASVGKS